MTIATLSDYYAAPKQRAPFSKAGTSGAGTSSMWAKTAVPAAGSLAIGNTANGLVPDNTTAGALAIQNFSGTGYVTAAEVSGGSTSARPYVALYDRLFHAGSYSFNAAVTLASQPSFSARVPGSDYGGLELWIEIATSFTGNPSITVTYTDQSGNPGHTTGAVSFSAALAVQPAMFKLPFASGDWGIQKIESVTCTVATVGTFNVIIARPLVKLFMLGLYQTDQTLRYWLDQTGMPQVYPTSCLALYSSATNSAIHDGFFEIASS